MMASVDRVDLFSFEHWKHLLFIKPLKDLELHKRDSMSKRFKVTPGISYEMCVCVYVHMIECVCVPYLSACYEPGLQTQGPDH